MIKEWMIFKRSTEDTDRALIGIQIDEYMVHIHLFYRYISLNI